MILLDIVHYNFTSCTEMPNRLWSFLLRLVFRCISSFGRSNTYCLHEFDIQLKFWVLFKHIKYFKLIKIFHMRMFAQIGCRAFIHFVHKP